MVLLDKIKQIVQRKKKADHEDGLDDDFDFDDIEDLDDYRDHADAQDDDFDVAKERSLDDLPSAGNDDFDPEPSAELDDGIASEADADRDPAPEPEPEGQAAAEPKGVEPANTDPFADQEDDIDLDALDREIAPEAADGSEDDPEPGAERLADDEDYDDDYEDYDDYDEGPSRKKLIMVMAAAVILVGSVIGGAGWWFLGASSEDDALARIDQPAPSGDVSSSTGFVLPPRGGDGGGVGSLNDLREGDDRPILADDDPIQGPAAPTFGPDPSANQQGFAVTNKDTDTLSRVPTTSGTGPRPAPQPSKFGLDTPLPPGGGAPSGGGQSLNEFAVAPRSELEIEFGISDGEPSPGVGVIAKAASLKLKERLPDLGAGTALAQAIDPGLIQTSEEGISLPVVSEDGRQSWQTYARPDDSDGKRLAIIIKDMGMSAVATEAIITRFPPEVTLSFSPYAQDAQPLVEQARDAGHEVWLSVPMEPINFPFVDPGPLGLFTAISRAENIERLNLALASIQGFVGVTTDHGNQFVVVGEYYRPILEELKSRGLAVADVSGSSRSLTPSLSREVGIPWAQSQMALGAAADPGEIDDELVRLEDLLKTEDRVLVTVKPYPNVLKALGAWLENLGQKGIGLAPVSAFLRVPPPPET